MYTIEREKKEIGLTKIITIERTPLTQMKKCYTITGKRNNKLSDQKSRDKKDCGSQGKPPKKILPRVKKDFRDSCMSNAWLQRARLMFCFVNRCSNSHCAKFYATAFLCPTIGGLYVHSVMLKYIQ